MELFRCETYACRLRPEVCVARQELKTKWGGKPVSLARCTERCAQGRQARDLVAAGGGFQREAFEALASSRTRAQFQRNRKQAKRPAHEESTNMDETTTPATETTNPLVRHCARCNSALRSDNKRGICARCTMAPGGRAKDGHASQPTRPLSAALTSTPATLPEFEHLTDAYLVGCVLEARRRLAARSDLERALAG